MITVRQYESRDLAGVERICIDNAGKRAKQDPEYGQMILYMYNRYYTSKSPEYCFVAADENDTPLGYIICAPDRRAYDRDYVRCEIAAIRKFSLSKALLARAEMLISLPYKRRYPAHLHIDLDERARHSGTGTRLMTALCDKLRAQGIPGVMLIVSSGNKNAVSFYGRNGFKIAGRLFGSAYVMAKKL